ncbi:hypothetical protein BAOM_3092 [Peribacillus asahii]|uniref:Uncharacterized protein n=1 Tax=Peribacillus asahii TaxID=228899 RepID=A0A3T0KU34_9BACI|nr:hypothetical protein [Peribacillus asahii]AZV43701.1 hypothetical protein BAOM_3092 [Peribacillus asahii]
MVTTLIVGGVVKLAGICGIGVGVSGMLKFFHEYELNFKKKGDKNANNDQSESLRERASRLH